MSKTFDNYVISKADVWAKSVVVVANIKSLGTKTQSQPERLKDEKK